MLMYSMSTLAPLKKQSSFLLFVSFESRETRLLRLRSYFSPILQATFSLKRRTISQSNGLHFSLANSWEERVGEATDDWCAEIVPKSYHYTPKNLEHLCIFKMSSDSMRTTYRLLCLPLTLHGFKSLLHRWIRELPLLRCAKIFNL